MTAVANLARDAASAAESPVSTGRFEADADAFSAYWRSAADAIERLPPKPKRDAAAQRQAMSILEAARGARVAFLEAHVETIYRKLTGDLGRYVRLEQLLFEAAALVPGLVPSRETLAREA
jgi:thioesterase DpgC